MVRTAYALLRRLGRVYILPPQTYRVFIVWGRSWKAIVLPCSLLAGTGGKSYATFFLTTLLSCLTSVTIGFCVHSFKNSHLDVTEVLYADSVSAFMTTYLALVLAMNIITLGTSSSTGFCTVTHTIG